MGKTKLLLIISVACIIAMGLMMIFNITSAQIIDKSLEIDTKYDFLKQIIFLCVGIFLGLVIYLFGYKNILRLSPLYLFVFSIFLCLVFVPKIGLNINGARRWIGFSFFMFQPSEFVKYLIPLYAINFFYKKDVSKDFFSFLKFLSVLLIPMFLIIMQPDNGTAIIILSSLVVLLFLKKIRYSFWAMPLTIVLLVGATIAYNMPHVRSRIKVYLNPESDLIGKGHQPYQAKIAVGSGGLYGRGVGQSIQKFNYLPQARSDYIAAIFAEEFGFLGILVLITLYLFVGFAGFYIAICSRDKEGFFVSSILTFLICFQAFLNLANFVISH